jgi:hypothetical protein
VRGSASLGECLEGLERTGQQRTIQQVPQEWIADLLWKAETLWADQPTGLCFCSGFCSGFCWSHEFAVGDTLGGAPAVASDLFTALNPHQ